MKYETKFNLDQVVCFKDVEGGVMQGKIMGIKVEQDHDWDQAPSSYELSKALVPRLEVTYTVLVRPSNHGDRGILRRVAETKTALTFEDAWKLA